MKYLYSLILVFLFIGCKPKPEFYIDGKPYYTNTHCVKSHIETKYGYHWGYNMFSGKYEWHWGSYTENVCDESRTDTIEIK